jgi:hypothetical protein
MLAIGPLRSVWPIRDLQALADYATAAFTLQRYTHHYEASAKRTADAMGGILPERGEGDPNRGRE